MIENNLSRVSRENDFRLKRVHIYYLYATSQDALRLAMTRNVNAVPNRTAQFCRDEDPAFVPLRD